MAKNSKHIGGLGELVEGLINLEKQYAEVARAATAEIAKRAVEIAKEIIESGGEGDWADHADATPELTQKLRSGTTRNLLDETGELKNSIKITSNTVAFGKVHVEIGSDSVYAAIQEYGGHPFGAVGPPGQAGFIPPRPYLRPAINRAIWESIGGDLEERIARACDLIIQKKKWRHLFK